MSKRGAEPGLAAKPLNICVRALRVEALDSDVAAQDAILRHEHCRCPSRPEAPVDAKAIAQHDPWLDLGRHRHTRRLPARLFRKLAAARTPDQRSVPFTDQVTLWAGPYLGSSG